MANTALHRYKDFSIAASALPSQAEAKFPALPLPALKHLFQNGLSRGTVAQVSGRRSCGRTAIAFHVLAQATARGETCAVVDLNDSFHPHSAHVAGISIDRIVWVRCHGNAEHAIRATDLLLHAGGFGVVLLDLCDASARVLNRIPLSYWYRFRRAVEHTPSILLVCADFACAKGAQINNLELESKVFNWGGRAPFLLLRGLEIQARLCKAALQPLFASSVSIEAA